MTMTELYKPFIMHVI